MSIERESSLKFWEDKHKEYNRENIAIDDWLDSFESVISSTSKPILDLGCGSGNDTLYLINKGKKVIACDQSRNSINNIKKNFPEVYDTKCFDMLDGIPFDDNMFDVIIADLCLHYFREKDTLIILKDIRRILTNEGHLIFRVNSMNDTNYGAGEGKEIEHHLYETKEGMFKRFFDDDDLNYFFKDFKVEYMHEEVMTRYGLEKRLYKCMVKNNKN